MQVIYIQWFAICKVCRKTVVTKSGNTSNLFHHLKHKHKSQYEESLKIHEATTTSGPRGKKIPTQMKIASAFANCVPYDKKSVHVAQWLEHCVSSAKVVGSIPREHTC